MEMSFLPKCYTAVNCLLFYKETGDSTLYHFFLYCDVAIFFMLCESGFLTKYSSISYIKRKKTSELSRLEAGNCPHFRNSESP